MSQLYQPLDGESVQIRLLSFIAGHDGSLVACTLERYFLFNAPEYNALSYCWGDENLTTGIIVNGLNVLITSNLAAALNRARELDPAQRLWADALCINQVDDHEKSQQVKQMKHIYERAQTTYAWLADPVIHRSLFLWQAQQPLAPRSVFKVHGKLRTLVSKHPTSARDDSLMLGIRSSPACQALFEIVQNDYWRRRWIIQELVAARQVKIMDGHAIIALEDLMIALQQYTKSDQWTTQYEMASIYLREILQFRENYLEERSLTLCAAIMRTKEYLSKDFRDRVFAMIGICSDGQDLVPLPSYRQTREEITRDLTRRYILRNANLDIIFVATFADTRPASFSSWAPDWLSADLDMRTQELADAAPVYPRMLANYALKAEVDVLKVQGVALGRIIRKTCPLGWQWARASDIVCDCNNDVEHGPIPSYYQSRQMAGHALRRCLSVDNIATISKTSVWFWSSYGSWRICNFLGGMLRPRHRYTQSHYEEYKAYSQWMWNHRKFTVRGKSIGVMLQGRGVPLRVLLPPILCLMLASLDGWFIHYCSQRRPLQFGYFIAPFILSGVLFATVLASLYPVIMLERGLSATFRTHMREKLDLSTSLVILDNGRIGMASANSAIGDLVCFIAGCKSLAVLRSQPQSQSPKYTVVGSCSMALKRADEKKYNEMRKLLKSKEKFDTIMMKLSRNDGWTGYDLI